MSQVISFTGYVPPARFDLQPWTAILVEEAAAEVGVFAVIDTIAISPVDTDPAHPTARSFTTSLASDLPDLWYRVVFVDAASNESQPTTPVQNSASTVAFQAASSYASRTELARILKVDETANAAALDRVLLAAAGEINNEIGHLDLTGWQRALAEEVNLERAVEHWQQRPFGIISLGPDVGASHTSRDTWERHAVKLTPLKDSSGASREPPDRHRNRDENPARRGAHRPRCPGHRDQNVQSDGADDRHLPARRHHPEPEDALGFGQIVGEETIVWTVRARVNTADYEAGQLLLLEFADPASSYCVASALEDEPTLNGYVSSVNVGSPTGHRFYSDAGIQWASAPRHPMARRSHQRHLMTALSPPATDRQVTPRTRNDRSGSPPATPNPAASRWPGSC
jgi:hypothetical protein